MTGTDKTFSWVWWEAVVSIYVWGKVVGYSNQTIHRWITILPDGNNSLTEVFSLDSYEGSALFQVCVGISFRELATVQMKLSLILECKLNNCNYRFSLYVCGGIWCHHLSGF